MSGLLPFQPDVSPDHTESEVLSLTDERADEVFTALSSATARQILAALYESPLPATKLSDHTETSVQNVRYHLDRMCDAELVEVADTWYSEKGNEMQVYAPTDAAIILCGSTKSSTEKLRDAAPEFIGAIALAAGASAIVQRVYSTVLSPPTPQPAPRSVGMMAETAPTTNTGAESLFIAEPGVIFFIGCLTALAVFTVLRAVHRRRTD